MASFTGIILFQELIPSLLFLALAFKLLMSGFSYIFVTFSRIFVYFPQAFDKMLVF